MALQGTIYLYYYDEGVERTFELDQPMMIVGRSKKADIVIQDKHLSSQHFIVLIQDNAVSIEDLNSLNGSYLNGIKIAPHVSTLVQNNDKIAFSLESQSRYFQIKEIVENSERDYEFFQQEMTEVDGMLQLTSKSSIQSTTTEERKFDNYYLNLKEVESEVYKTRFLKEAHDEWIKVEKKLNELADQKHQKDIETRSKELAVINKELNQLSQELFQIQKTNLELEIERDQLQIKKRALMESCQKANDELFEVDQQMKLTKKMIDELNEQSSAELEQMMQDTLLHIENKKQDWRLEEAEYQYKLTHFKSDLQSLEEAREEVLRFKENKLAEIKMELFKEEEFFKLNKSHLAEEMAGDLVSSLTDELSKQKAKPIDKEIIDNVSKKIYQIVIQTFLSEQPDEVRRLNEKYKKSVVRSKIDEFLLVKLLKRNYFTIFLFFMFFTFPEFANLPKNIIHELSNIKGVNTDVKSQTEFVRNKIVSPPERYLASQTEKYYGTEVDNIIYHKNYLQKKNQEKFRDIWVLALNDVLVKKIELKDTVIVKVISLETKLQFDLEKMVKHINPKTPQVQISEMRKVEKIFRSKMTMLLEGERNFDQYLELKKNVWADYFVRGEARDHY